MKKPQTRGFRWLPSFYQVTRHLPDAERLQIYDAIADYGFGNEVDELPPTLDSLFILMKPNIESSIRFFQKQKDNGDKGGRPPKKPKQNPKETQKKPKRNREGEGEGEGDSENMVGKPPRFSVPTVEEVAAYCRERRNGIDAQQFVDYYTANGWKVGKGLPMKDWKAAVRTWENRTPKPVSEDWRKDAIRG